MGSPGFIQVYLHGLRKFEGMKLLKKEGLSRDCIHHSRVTFIDAVGY
jgi:hypothetical protein